MSIRALIFAAVLLVAPAAVAGAPPASLEPVLAELAEDRIFERYDVGLQVVDLESGEEVFARNADTLLSPASTTKVLTSATALKTLGPAYRFRTAVLADAEPDSDGVVNGNLYIRGGGDPSLVIEKLWRLALDLELAGVKSVRGDVVYDDTFFDPDTRLHGWDKPADVERGPAYFPALSALSLNFNTVAILARPGSAPGQDAVVRLETPAGEYVTLSSSVKTGSAGSRRGIRIARVVREDRGMAFTVTGSMPAGGSSARYYRTVADPTGQFAGAFGALLAERGIAVTGGSRRAATPEEAVELASLESRPLAVLLMDMNKFSSNFIAEMVLRTLGAEQSEGPGSTASGLVAVRAYLESLGLGDSDFVLVNGSGLSKDARLTPAALNAVLFDMHRDPTVGSEFAASLAVAGWDGTLSRRLEDTPGLLRGKTGTINGVHGLTGYISAGDGRRYAFAFLVNNISGSTSQVRDLHDSFAQKLLVLGQASVAEAEEEGAR